MRIDKGMEKSMGMDEAVWARHANPWSFYTRVPILPLLGLAVWSRVWLGWWCLVPLVLVIAWTFYNPRAFPPPKTLDHWTSKGVLGEQLWLARKDRPIPAHHARWAFWLSVASGLSILPMIWGLYALSLWPALLGCILSMTFKMWFVDRMVWLYEETKHQN
jgi:hypothetical protein